MIYCIDIDGTICSKDNEDYNFAVPYEDRIEIINQLYEEGNKIIFFINFIYIYIYIWI